MLEVNDLIGMMDSKALHQHELAGREFARLTDRRDPGHAAEYKDMRERARHAVQEAKGAHRASFAVHTCAHPELLYFGLVSVICLSRAKSVRLRRISAVCS